MLGLVPDNSHRKWEGVVVIFRSLGRRILAAWVVKEVRQRLSLDYDPEVFLIRDDHIVLQLSSEGDCVKVLEGGPWFVEGQLMAFASWESDFLPGCKSQTFPQDASRLIGSSCGCNSRSSRWSTRYRQQSWQWRPKLDTHSQ